MRRDAFEDAKALACGPHDTSEDPVARRDLRGHADALAPEQRLQSQSALLDGAQRVGVKVRQGVGRLLQEPRQLYLSRLSTILSATALAGTL
jgi:hypothetical protein